VGNPAENTEEVPPVEEGEELVTLDTGSPEEESPAVEEPQYEPPEATAAEKKTAAKVYRALKDADILSPEAAVDGVLQLMDILPVMTVPEEWPGVTGEEYSAAPMVGEMADILIKGSPRLTIKDTDLICLWRNKEKWVKGGKTVRGNAKPFDTRVRHLVDGKKASIEINYHHFLTLNPLQRTFAVYHELRLLAEDGSKRKPDFEGFYDELEIFGSRVFRDMMELARVMELGAQVTYQHQLPLFEEE
jgi:hypothetical protein